MYSFITEALLGMLLVAASGVLVFFPLRFFVREPD
jgi:hypothetical protein